MDTGTTSRCRSTPRRRSSSGLLAAYTAATGRDRAARGRRRRNVREASPEQHRVRHVVSRAAPYPGHDVDEKIPIDDLHRGTRVLIAALADIACGPRIEQPFAR